MSDAESDATLAEHMRQLVVHNPESVAEHMRQIAEHDANFAKALFRGGKPAGGTETPDRGGRVVGIF